MKDSTKIMFMYNTRNVLQFYNHSLYTKKAKNIKKENKNFSSSHTMRLRTAIIKNDTLISINLVGANPDAQGSV